MEEQIGSKLEKEFVKAMYCYPAYLTYVEYCAMLSHSVLSDCNPMDCSPPGSSVLGDSSSKNTGVDCCNALLQGIFPTQGLNPGVLHSRRILYHLSHQGTLAQSTSCKMLSWNQDFWDKYQQPQICRYHSNGRKWRRTKEPLDESERGEWETRLKTQHSKN